MFRLALRYILYHRVKTVVMVLSISLAAYLPVVTSYFLDRVQIELRSRAESTPLIVGARGSQYDLTLHALYFESVPPGRIRMQDALDVADSELADAVPLYVRYQASGYPIVGTTLKYLKHRNLEVAEGTPMLRLGDCVLGSEVARQLKLKPGDKLLSDQENLFDIKEYSLEMRVTGVLAPTNTADDRTVICDLKTVWVIEGIGHGHQEMADASDKVVLEKKGNQVVANAALPTFLRITDDNIASFHFHGEPGSFPISAVIVYPPDRRSRDILMGRYVAEDLEVQIVEPAAVIEQLLRTVFKVKRFFDANAILIALSTVSFISLIVLLSVRLRAREMQTMFKLGCGRLTLIAMQATELMIIAAACTVLVLLASGLTVWVAPDLIRRLLFLGA